MSDTIQPWLDHYSDDHRNPTNQTLHWICVPLIVWCVVALLWTLPVPAFIGRTGFWAVAALVLAFAWYWRHSHRLGLALLVALVVLAAVTGLLDQAIGPVALRWSALAVFVLAWIGQFVGHIFEGRRPSFFTDLAYLLIGPAWLMEKLLRRLGLGRTA